jgi:4-amino-4-deoxy-L-arabinose transferase-like glycosyltransferase
MARNIYEGKGFSTSVLRPLHFLSFKTLPHPEVTRPPVYPYLIALSYWLFGVNDFSVVMLNGLFYVILIVATFLFSVEFSKSKSKALMTAACIALSGIFLKIGILGSSDIVYAAFVTLFFYVYAKYPEKSFVHGLLLGLLYLTRMNTVFLILAIVLVDFSFFNRRDWKRLAFFVIGMLLVASPGFIRSFVMLDPSIPSVNTAVLFTRSFPGFSYWTRLDSISAWDFIKMHPEEFFEKLAQKFFYLIKDFQNTFGIVFLALVVIGLLIPAKNELHKRLKKIILVTALLQTLVIVSVVNSEARYYIFLMPIIISFVFTSINSLGRKYLNWLVPSLILLSVVLSSINYWKSPKQLNHYILLGQAVKAATQNNAVIASDIAWEITWYADRKTVWLPYDLETMNKISMAVPIDYVFLSINLSQPLALYKDNIWPRLFFNADSFKIPEFKLINVFYYGNTPIGVLYKIEKKSNNQEPS